jgi:hypothetical protein
MLEKHWSGYWQWSGNECYRCDCVLSVMRHQKYVKRGLVFFAYQRISGGTRFYRCDCACGDEDQDQEELERKLLLKAVSLYPKTWRYCRKALHLRSKNLFSIFPRRNFLKSDTVEYRHIIDEFQCRFSAPKYLFHFFS